MLGAHLVFVVGNALAHLLDQTRLKILSRFDVIVLREVLHEHPDVLLVLHGKSVLPVKFI